MFKGKLILSGNNAKTIKGDGTEFETAIMYLAPADQVTRTTLCPMAIIAGCKEGCLNTAGRGRMNGVQAARERKSQWYENDCDGFMAQLVDDVARFERYCQRKGVQGAVRLNGTSDIPFERIAVPGFANIMEAFPGIQFYDYTKTSNRVKRALPANYHLTLSYSEASGMYQETVERHADETGVNVAVVFRDAETRARYMARGFMGREVIDGDKTDLRFTDPAGVVVGLYAKGSAKRDTSGFVVD